MIAKVALFLAAVAVARASIIAPALSVPTAIRTGTIVSIPGATTVDKRIIGTNGLLGGATLVGNGLLGTPLIGNGLIGAPLLGKGLIGGPLAINNGLLAPGLIGAPGLLGINAGILATPGMLKTIL